MMDEPDVLRLLEGLTEFMDRVAGLVSDLVGAHEDLVEIVEGLDRELAALSGQDSAQTWAALRGEAQQARRQAGRLTRQAAATGAVSRELREQTQRLLAEEY